MDKVFSEFEVKNTSVKFKDDTTATKVGCVGSLDEAMNSKTITKKCEGVVVKSVTKGDGTGELTLSLHMLYNLYLKSFGMISDGLKDGVFAYGRNSIHNSFTLTCEVYDEDGIKKLKAYPNCVVTSGVARKIENGAEEVAELELTVSVMPDEYGNGLYECIATEVDETIVNTWLTAFDPSLLQVASA